MESKAIYQQSYDELVRVRKTLTNSTITIHLDKLDAVTKHDLLEAITKTTSRRQSDILGVIGNTMSSV